MGSYNGQGGYSNGPKWAEIQMFHDTVLVGHTSRITGLGRLCVIFLGKSADTWAKAIPKCDRLPIEIGPKLTKTQK